MLSLCWHYLLCIALLFLCHKAKRSRRFLLCAAATGLMLVVAVVGFWLVYVGPFAESGKTFAMYITRYAAFTLPIFAFPLAGFVLTLLSRRT